MAAISSGYDDPLVGALARELHGALRFGADRMRAVVPLPPASKADNESLCLAIQLVLERDFKLHFPPEQMRRLRAGEPVQFVEGRRSDGLPCRRVAILLAAEFRRLEVVGVDPEDGEDGWSELRFAWQRQAGMEDERGNIDWKRLNTFPHVKAGSVLAVLHPHTAGRPGIDAGGRKVKQRVGRPLKVRWDDKSIAASETPEGLTELRSRTAGIVEFLLARPGDPRTLAKLAITDTITINGDVDYRIGDQGSHEQEELSCHANIVVTGDVLGIFSLQSKGFIHVRGAIEGRLVEAAEVEAGVITAHTTVRGHRSVVADNVVRGTIEGGEVVIRRNVNGAMVRASSCVRLEATTAVLGATFFTPRLIAEGARFTGRTRIVLGQDIFDQEPTAVRALAGAAAELEKGEPGLRRAVTAAAEQLTALERVVVRACSSLPPAIAQPLNRMKQAFVTGVQRPKGPFPKAFFQLCRQLQDALADQGVHPTVHGKVDVFLRSVAPLQEELCQLAQRLQQQNEAEEQLADLRRRAAALEVCCQRIQLGPTAEIVIEAGGTEEVLTASNLPDQDFAFAYQPPSDPHRIAGGRLVRESPAESF